MILADILFKQGFGTRYDCRSIATSGAVSIDGRELTDPDEDFDLEGLVLTWRGMQWPVSDNVLIAMNKPTGYECSLKPSAHPSVMNLLPGPLRTRGVQPVGRLDWDTTGLLILTNDGDFTDKMIHPRNEIDKVYLARVKGIATKENLRPLTRGVVIDGKKTQPAHYNIIKVDHEKNRSVVELTIHEGRNHQVKKMFESVGLIVDKLSRTRFGTLDLTGLRPGESRRLSKKEISQLHNIAVNKVK